MHNKALHLFVGQLLPHYDAFQSYRDECAYAERLLTPKNLLINVNTAHKYVLRLSTRRAELPIILRLVHFKMYLRGREDASCVFSGMCCAVTVGV